MADKPRTYPQQIQDLKLELEQKDAQLNKALQDLSLLPDLQEELVHLRAQLELANSGNSIAARTEKAQKNDLEQRASSAEQTVRNLQVINRGLVQENEALIQQVDTLGRELNSHKGKDQKIYLLNEDLRKLNETVAALNQRIREQDSRNNEAVLSLQRQVRFHSDTAESYRRVLEDMRQTISQAPDTIAVLKRIAGIT